MRRFEKFLVLIYIMFLCLLLFSNDYAYSQNRELSSTVITLSDSADSETKTIRADGASLYYISLMITDTVNAGGLLPEVELYVSGLIRHGSTYYAMYDGLNALKMNMLLASDSLRAMNRMFVFGPYIDDSLGTHISAYVSLKDTSKGREIVSGKETEVLLKFIGVGIIEK